MTGLLALLCGVGIAVGVVVAVAAWNGWAPKRRRQARQRAPMSQGAKNRLIAAVVVMVAVAVVTRLPVAVLVAGALVWFGPAVFGAGKAGRSDVAMLEAIAVWTESLRDTIAGDAGLEQAIVSSVDSAPQEIQPELRRLTGRLRAKEPLPLALGSFADDLADPAIDMVVAALVQNSQLRGPGLVGTLGALATSERETLEARVKIEQARRSLRRNGHIIMLATVGFAALMAALAPDFLAPYRTPAGNVALIVVIGIFSAGFAIIRAGSVIRPEPRFLAPSEDLARAAGPGATS